jgi:hypothetical protein
MKNNTTAAATRPALLVGTAVAYTGDAGVNQPGTGFVTRAISDEWGTRFEVTLDADNTLDGDGEIIEEYSVPARVFIVEANSFGTEPGKRFAVIDVAAIVATATTRAVGASVASAAGCDARIGDVVEVTLHPSGCYYDGPAVVVGGTVTRKLFGHTFIGGGEFKTRTVLSVISISDPARRVVLKTVGEFA